MRRVFEMILVIDIYSPLTDRSHAQRSLTNGRILLVNLLQSSRSTFSWGSFLSFFAFKKGVSDTQVSASGG